MQFKASETEIRLGFSFVAVIALMLLLCDEKVVLISFFSSLFHEGGHLIFMLIFSAMPEKITFGAYGIRIERSFCDNLSWQKEVLISMGGIFGNAILSVISFTISFVSGEKLFTEIFAVNIFIATFNLLPVKALDFGRCIGYIANAYMTVDKAECFTRFLSVFTVVVIFIGSALYNLFVNINISLIAVTAYIIVISTLKEFHDDK